MRAHPEPALHFGRTHYSADVYDIWRPAEPLTRSTQLSLRKHVAQFDRFFEDVYSPREDGIGGRLIPAAELREQYPDDLEAGKRWSEEQLRDLTTV